ncbi:WD40-repeat-containing domain protein, partial [Rhizoctonia solani]
SIAFSPHRNYIASSGSQEDKSVVVWHTATGSIATGPLWGHTSRIYLFAFSPDNTLIFSCLEDKTIWVWDIRQDKFNSIDSITCSHLGIYIATGTSNHTEAGITNYAVRVWNVLTGRYAFPPLEGHTNCIRSLMFSPDKANICSGSDNTTVIVWGLDTCANNMVGQPFTGHTGSVWLVVYSVDSIHIASGADDATVRVWNTSMGTLIHTLDGYVPWVKLVAFSPDGNIIVSGGHGMINQWDVHSDTYKGSMECNKKWTLSWVSFSPEGDRIIA